MNAPGILIGAGVGYLVGSRRSRTERPPSPTPSQQRTERPETTYDAPDPDHPSKPDAPQDMTAPSWRYVARRTLGEFSKDQCTDIAASLTYYAVLALFPAVIALLSLVGVVGQASSTVETVLQILRDVGGGSVATAVEPFLTSLATSPGAGAALVVGLLGALWSASGYVNSFSRAMNRMYEVEEGRPIWKLRPVMLLVTLVMVLLAATVLVALVLTGPAADAVGSALGIGSTFVTVWSIAKWPVVLVMVMLIVAVLFWSTPNVQQPKFRWISVGAAVAILTWIAVSAAFGLYVANVGSYDKTYGSLAGVIVFLLWLWLTNLALLFGAELDAELERTRQLQAGLAAEETLQLPPRDTTTIDKAAEKHEAVVARGRALRKSRGESDEPAEARAGSGAPGGRR